MDFKLNKEDEQFRSEVAAFVNQELPWDWRNRSLDPDEPEDAVLVKEFKKKLAGQGWLTMAWPEEYGGSSASHVKQMILNEEMAYRGVPQEMLALGWLAQFSCFMVQTSKNRNFYQR